MFIDKILWKPVLHKLAFGEHFVEIKLDVSILHERVIIAFV